MANRRFLSFRVLIVLCSAAMVCLFVLYRGGVLPRPADRTGSADAGNQTRIDDTTVFPGSKFGPIVAPSTSPDISEQIMSGSKSGMIVEPKAFEDPLKKPVSSASQPTSPRLDP